MADCVVFHTQIASIMEVLANAAVANICKLVDDDYAVFRMEINQSQKENRSLRRKLLELKVARERAERTMRERVLAIRPSNVKISDRYRGTARGTFCNAEAAGTVAPLPSVSFEVVNQNWILVRFWILCNISHLIQIKRSKYDLNSMERPNILF
jgi:hypothetical protein